MCRKTRTISRLKRCIELLKTKVSYLENPLRGFVVFSRRQKYETKIRRLRLLVDGYRARAKHNADEADKNCDVCSGAAEELERRRIITALRVLGNHFARPATYDKATALRDAATALEKGEL